MAGQPDASQPRRHLIIAGTGRAGTTFLVRYLTAMGLDTHLSRRGESAWLDEAAQAGLEDFPIGPESADLPYVIKNPMLYEFVEQVISSKTMQIDGVIIPVRNLREATSSRLILERRSMYEHLPWLGYMDKAWDTAGNVPGGLIFSLNALDEARTLSMGLHLLVERLVHANIPMVFLDFPRIVTDADYLFEKVVAFLPARANQEAATIAHAKLADPEKVRIEREIAANANRSADIDLDEQIDRIALRRELVRLRSGDERPESAKRSAEMAEAEAVRLRAQVISLEALRAQAVADVADLRTELKKRDASYHELNRRHEELKTYFALASEQLDGLAERSSLAWLNPSDSEARARIIAAERLTYDFLVGFADDVASIADSSNAILLVTEMRKRFAAVLAQLEATNDELTIVTERLARRGRYPGRRLLRRVIDSRTFNRVKSLLARTLGRAQIRN